MPKSVHRKSSSRSKVRKSSRKTKKVVRRKRKSGSSKMKKKRRRGSKKKKSKSKVMRGGSDISLVFDYNHEIKNNLEHNIEYENNSENLVIYGVYNTEQKANKRMDSKALQNVTKEKIIYHAFKKKTNNEKIIVDVDNYFVVCKMYKTGDINAFNIKIGDNDDLNDDESTLFELNAHNITKITAESLRSF